MIDYAAAKNIDGDLFRNLKNAWTYRFPSVSMVAKQILGLARV